MCVGGGGAGANQLFEMFLTQNPFRCLPQRNKKRAWWNIDFAVNRIKQL